MRGFLPLIEGFLAFALTMVALTTAVSAIVGIFHRLRRRRARGLRDMIRILFSDEIAPLLAKVEQGVSDKPLEDEDPRAEAMLQAPEARARFIADMTLAPIPRVSGERLKAEKERPAEGRESASAESEKDLLSGVEQTLVDLESLKKLRPKEPPPEFVKKLLAWRPRFWRLALFGLSRWRSLAFGLDALTEEELEARLAHSRAGKALAAGAALDWKVFVEGFAKRFKVLGSASTESLARHSRKWSVAVGFVLAFAINIDSLDLLNTYLSDPAARGDVLQMLDEVMEEAKPQTEPKPSGEPDEPADSPTQPNQEVVDPVGSETPPDPGGSTPPEPECDCCGPKEPAAKRLLDRVDEVLDEGEESLRRLAKDEKAPRQLRELVELLDREPSVAELREAIDEVHGKLESVEELLRATVTPEDLGRLSSALDGLVDFSSAMAEVEALGREVEQVSQGVAEAQKALGEARNEVLEITSSLTNSFPIGWDRYPNCGGVSPDPRCSRLPKDSRKAWPPMGSESEEQGQQEKGFWSIVGSPVVVLWNGLVFLWNGLAFLSNVASIDPAGFFEWFSGVILTGLLLGLGTPFWVEVVNRITPLRRWMQNKKQQGGAGGAGGAPPTP